MTGLEIGLASMGAMVVLIYLGLQVPLVLMLTSFVGVWIIRDNFELSTRLLGLAASEAIKGYIFGVVPLFVLMGLLVSASGMGRDTFAVANQLFRRVLGGLGIATVFANAIFAAVTGVSIASLAVFTKVAVPEMLRYGYRPRFAVGVVAGSSVLGMLIPPSLLLIIYGVLTESSIGDLFLAGIIPGIILSVAYVAGILLTGWLRPAMIVGPTAAGTIDDADRLSTLGMVGKLSPICILILLVLGGIYGGIFTPTEAAAAGALFALIFTLARRALSPTRFWRMLVEAGHVTASISFVVVAASMYGRMLALSGLPNQLGDWLAASGLGLEGTLVIYVAIVLLMGTILDSTSILLIIVPLILPVMQAFGVDLIWFGIITIVAVEIGILTPPLGLAIFVLKGALDDKRIGLGDIFIGAAPFALIMLLVLILLIMVPELSTALI